MSECVVRMEMPKACSWIENGEKKKCPISEWGGACAITKQFKMPDGCRPSWCPIVCALPEGHGKLVDADALMELMLERKRPLIGADSSKDRYRYMQWLADFNAIKDAKTIVPEERRETNDIRLHN